MPLVEPWITAYGFQDSIESVFVQLKFDVADGWGECSPAPIPTYNSEYAKGAYCVARDVLAPSIIGTDISTSSQITNIFNNIKGNEFAKSAFDCAWWDAFAKSQKKPLWKLIGGKKKNVSVGADLPVQPSKAHLLERVTEAVKQGFKRVKIKFNRDCTVNMIASVREAFPDILVHIDCNSGFTLEDIDLFVELDELGLSMIEQPLAYDDLVFHADLQQKLNTSICLDESITSIERAKKAIDIGACRWINIKTSRVGGLSNGIAIHNLCRLNSIPVWIGGMLESSVGQGFSLALATMNNVSYPCDIFPSSRFYKKDFSFPEVKLNSPGMISAPEAFGVGFAPDEDLIQRTSLEKTRLVNY